MIRSKIVVDKETYDEVKQRIYANPKASEALQKTKAITKKYKRMAIIAGTLAFLIFMVIWSFYMKGNYSSSDSDTPHQFLIYILIAIAEGIIPCLVASIFIVFFPIEAVGKKQTKGMMKNNVFPLILSSLFTDEVKYYEKGGVNDDKYLESLGFFSGGNVIHHEALTGICLGVPFSCEDILTYNEGGYGEADSTEFTGTIIRLRYNKPSKSTIIIASKQKSSGLKRVEGPKVELESPEFSKKYYVVGKDREDVFRVLTLDAQNRFEEVGKLTDAPVIFKIQGDVIEIVFGGPTDSILDSASKFSGDKDLSNVIKGMLFIEYLIKTLDLNNTYWLNVEKNKVNVNDSVKKKENAVTYFQNQN